MDKILVDGYFQNNLGDDLFFRELLSRYPDTMFYFRGVDAYNEKILTTFDNARVINVTLFSLMFRVHRFKGYVMIGGSMFQQNTRNIKWLKRWLALLILILIFKISGKKTSIIGFNFGPYKTRSFLQLYRKLFKVVDFLSVRDKNSFNLLKNSKSVHYYPDIVFNTKFNVKNIQSQKNALGISIMDFGKNVNFQRSYEKFIKNVIDKINDDMIINLYGFQESSEVNDREVIDRIVNAFPNKKFNVQIYDGYNIDDFITSYYTNQLFLTSRFHSLVLALKANGYPIIINYNVKVQNLVDSLQLKYSVIQPSEFDSENRAERIACEINNKNDFSSSSMSEVNKLSFQSTRHFTELDRLLKK